jgi:hypothetical protein
MSAFATNSRRTSREVREVTQAAVSRCSNMPCAEGRVIDHLVSADEQLWRHFEAKRPS